MHTLRAKLEEKIQQRHMLAHEFYLRWQTGKLTKPELQGYVKEYYSFESEFPRFLSSLHSRCENLEIRQQLLENLNDEERGEFNHPELWLRFAEGLDVDRAQVKNHFRSDETEHLLRTFRKLTQSGNLIDGLVALYVYERQQPDVARQKIDGLRVFYNISDDRTIAFFKAHQSYDVFHAETEANLLDRLCLNDADVDRALAVAEETLNALYEFLDGITRRYAQAA